MLKSHKNLLEPRPSDRLRVGERIVDIPLREIAPAMGGDAVRVTQKSLSVLMVLVAHANRLVSREALLEWVWPDTLPTDDVVTQAITQLRKALGDDRDHPRYIETLSKQGYRLIAPVEWLIDAEAEPLQPASIPASGRAPMRWRWPLLAVGLAAAAVLGYWRWHEATSPHVSTVPAVLQDAKIKRIASSPQREASPSLSPDGSLVVYVLGSEDQQAAALVLQTASAVPPRPLTDMVEGRWDAFPVWSPNGREIAFLRSTNDDCTVMLMPAAGGAAREIGDCVESSMPMAWFPDGKSLVTSGWSEEDSAQSRGSALYRMTIGDGRWQQIVYERTDEDIDVRPQVSPDGRWIAFQRNLSLGDLWRIPVEGGKPQRLTSLRTNFNGLAWTADSRSLVFSRLRSDGTVLAMLDIASGALAEYRDADAGLSAPSVAMNGDSVAFVLEDAQSQLRELRVADGEQAFERAKIVYPSSRSDILPAISPDGRQMLFVSDRDGQTRLWWADMDQPDSLRAIDGMFPMPRFPAMWSADSTRALVIGDSIDGRKTAYEIEPRTGRIVRLDVPDAVPVHLAYHPDPTRILVIAEREQGRLGLILYDRSVRPWRALAQIDDAVLAFADPAEKRIVFVRTYKHAIWQTDLNLRDLRQVDEVSLRPRIRTLTPTVDGAWVLDVGPSCEWLWRRVSGTRPVQSQCLGSSSDLPSGVSFDAASGRLFAATPNFSRLDIGLLPLSVFASADMRDSAGQ